VDGIRKLWSQETSDPKHINMVGLNCPDIKALVLKCQEDSLNLSAKIPCHVYGSEVSISHMDGAEMYWLCGMKLVLPERTCSVQVELYAGFVFCCSQKTIHSVDTQTA